MKINEGIGRDGIKMNALARLEMIADSYIRFVRTGDVEHRNDMERILEYDGLADSEE